MTEHFEALAGSQRQDGRARNEDAFLMRNGPPLVGALAPLAELPEAILREAWRSGRADDMTVVAVRQR